MLSLLKRLKGLGEGEPAASPLETFGRARIARALGEEILESSADRKGRVQSIRDRLTAMTRFQKDDLIDRLFARLALFVFDLPASEANHHRERFGLLDHLLDVAERSAQALTGSGFQVSPEPSVNHREGPLWAYAGVIAAVAHDIGKPLDLEVVAPGASVSWDPRSEPLRLYCDRHKLSGTGPELWHFHKGRGSLTHERNIPILLPFVLTSEMETYLGPRLPSVLRALSPEENWKTTPDLSPTAQEVVRIVRRIDKVTSMADHEERHPKRVTPPASSSASQLRLFPEVPAVREPAPPPIPVETAEPPPLPPDEKPLGWASFRLIRSLPPDFYPLPVPKHATRRGDPVETARRMDYELGPVRFQDTVRRMIVAKRLSRNGLYSQVYLTPGVLWLVVPEAWKTIATIIHLPYDQSSVARMLGSLGRSAFVEPAPSGEGTQFIKTRPDGSWVEGIRIRTQGFLKESELQSLGFHGFEIKVWDPEGRSEGAQVGEGGAR